MGTRLSVASMKIVASAIVHNEAERYFDLWLEHLLEFCDKVMLIDDASTDSTAAIAGTYGNVWCETNPTREFFVHEGRARQKLLEWTLADRPDYVLSIDADEFVSDSAAVRKSAESGSPVYTLQMEEVWDVDEEVMRIRWDGQWKPRPCPILWKAPERASRHWQIPDVKLACGREPIEVRRTRGHPSGSSVLHFGWANVSERQARAERYFEHDGGKFHRNEHLDSILWPDEKVETRAKLWPSDLLPLRSSLCDRANRSRL